MASGAQVVAAAVGGFLAAIIVYIVPDFVKYASDDRYVVNWGRLIRRKTPITVTFTAIAAALCYYKLHPGSGTGTAFELGFAVQAALKGVLATGRDIVQPITK